MRNVWAVTRKTFIQCARTRIIAAFGILLALCVLYAGFQLEGDGTLKGRIQTFLAYSTSLTQLLLSLVTIFLATSVVTGDIRHKYIFTVASKPLARWQYVLGRWCGVVMLTGLLLAVSIGAIYGLARHLRGTQTRTEQMAALGLTTPEGPDLDRLAVENEVFTARATHRPDPFKIDKFLEWRMKRLIEERGADTIIRNQILKELQPPPTEQGGQAPPDEAEVEKRLKNAAVRERMMEQIKADMRRQILAEIQLVRPGQSLRLTFSSLSTAPADGPLLQVRYRLHPFKSYTTVLKSTWQIVNPRGRDWFFLRSDSTETTSSFMVPPFAVADDGRLTIRYFNLPDPQATVTVQIKPEEITVLQHVGGFEGNLVRAGLMILLRLMFLTATAVLFGVFLSFPIACLSCLMIFTISMMSGFIHDATRLPLGSGPPSAFDYFSHYLAKGVFGVLPKFSATSATEPLIDGENIPWRTVAREYLMTFKRPTDDSNSFWRALHVEIESGMGLRMLLALAVGWLIFRRRELAGVN